MSKIIRVVVEYDDKILIAEGKEAEEWLSRVNSMETLYFTHAGYKDFKWTRVEEKKTLEKKVWNGFEYH